MLKALELTGFKSFADRTRFEFPAGITVVVGPNGSGKSNVVDAIKWVLGEQSVKSLRGKEMADVIFKGSGGENGRKPANSAEATLIFENADGRLPVDAPEVHVSRRVYISGEGEYLINRQPCRLKDIRDLFRGTGVGADAYSIIEQGRVDKLLQASSKDRRAIFEEAAGISRFKAKKVETQRRLERVEQNLLRLSDIVEEVESRLRSVRSQATKAQKYREYSQRLQQLRTQVAAVDWRKLTEQLTTLESQIADQRANATAAAEMAVAQETELHELEAATQAQRDEQRLVEEQVSALRAQIAQYEALVSHTRHSCVELDETLARQRQDEAALNSRSGDLRARLAEARVELKAAEEAHLQFDQHATERQKEYEHWSTEWDTIRQATETFRSWQVGRVQEAGRLAGRLQACELEWQAARTLQGRLQTQIDELNGQREILEKQTLEESTIENKFLDELAAVQVKVDKLQDELRENHRLLDSRQDDWTQLEGRRHGLAGRETFLEEMERTREGLLHGVRELLNAAEAKSSGPLKRIKGVVADVLHAPVDLAPLIDAALGEAAQYVVVEGELDDVVQLAWKEHFPTRITLVPSRPPLRGAMAVPPEDDGIIGRACDLVRVEPGYEKLVEQVLGTTWLVRSLTDALRLHETAPLGTRFVTPAGEILESAGMVVAGPRPTALGLVSRRSELHVVREELAVVEKQVSDVQDQLYHLRTLIKEQEESQRELVKATDASRQALAEVRVMLRSLNERREKVERQFTAAERERQEAEQTAAERQAEINKLNALREDNDRENARLAAELTAANARLAEIDRERQRANTEFTAARVQVAKSEQRLESLRTRMTQFEDDERERQRGLDELRQRLADGLKRRQAGDLDILQATSALALDYWQREIAQRQATELVRQQAAIVVRNQELASSLQSLRKKQKRAEDQIHQLELSAEGVRHERQTLATRLREDYSIELADLTNEASAEASEEELAERTAVEEEIETLRRKINQIGAVNVDALNELDDLESRFNHLSGQYKDLADAKEALVKIIHRINSDSRRLFLETLEAIRVNFQVLYRKAFGGGKADIVLEEGVDVLEAGVEIVATPPGKPSFNNSLLSGGERALTGVALLMSIFQFRPSPFCVLDEVDAPFDEANIGRFVDVLREFLSWTRFIVVTHSKKTMTAANTLYGVTMQESGVSKRVSVRFDEVAEDGQISAAAAARADQEPAPAADERVA